MNKAELIEAIAKDAGTSLSAVGRVLNALTSQVNKALKRGDEVTIPGIGKLTVTERAARKGRNPRTGEAVTIAAKKAVKFAAAKALKDAVQ